jgi:hypothetical protein
MAKTEEFLVPVEVFQFPVVQNDEELAEEMDGVYLSFDRVKIPSGGGVAFEVPGDDPDSPDMVKELIGVIIDHYPVQTYYENPLSGESTPPNCYSNDGKIGIGDPGGNCAKCPMNQWDSGRNGKGKACKSQRRLFLFREGEGLPIELTLPPTSLKNFNNFITKRIVGKGRRTHGVLTKVTLKKCKNANGIDYSEAQFAVIRDLSAEEKVQSKIYSSDMKEFTRRQNVLDDYEEPTVSETNDSTSEEDFA